MSCSSVTLRARAGIHEAGHALLHVVTATPFVYAEIRSDGGEVFEKELREDELHRGPDAAEKVFEVMIGLGGELAELAIFDRIDEHGLESDRRKVREALKGLSDPQRVEQECRRWVIEFFEQPAVRKALESVANALDRQSRLSAEQVAQHVPDAVAIYKKFRPVPSATLEPITHDGRTWHRGPR